MLRLDRLGAATRPIHIRSKWPAILPGRGGYALCATDLPRQAATVSALMLALFTILEKAKFEIHAPHEHVSARSQCVLTRYAVGRLSASRGVDCRSASSLAVVSLVPTAVCVISELTGSDAPPSPCRTAPNSQSLSELEA